MIREYKLDGEDEEFRAWDMVLGDGRVQLASCEWMAMLYIDEEEQDMEKFFFEDETYVGYQASNVAVTVNFGATEYIKFFCYKNKKTKTVYMGLIDIDGREWSCGYQEPGDLSRQLEKKIKKCVLNFREKNKDVHVN